MMESVVVEKLVELVVSFIWVPIVGNYYNTFLTHRFEKKIIIYVIWGLYGIFDSFYLQYSNESLFIRGICSIIIWVIIGCAIYRDHFKTIILVSLSFYFLSIIMEIIVGFIFILSSIQPAEHQLAGWIISKILLVMMIQLIRVRHKNKIEGDVSSTYWAMSILTPIGSIIMVYFISALTFELMSNKYTVVSTLAMVIMFIMNLFIFSVYDKLQKETTLRQKNIMYAQQAEIFKQQCEEREAIWLEARNRHHDFKHHLISLQSYVKEQKIEDLNRYLNQLIDNYEISYWKNKSGNIIIDSQLAYRLKKAEDANILLETEFSILKYLPFDDVDLCVIVGNIFENAIEAVKKLSDTERKIKLKIKFEKNILYISISNPYIGTIESNVKGKLLTSKEDKMNHGIGISSVEKTVSKYDGTMEIDKSDNLFKLKIMMYGLNSWTGYNNSILEEVESHSLQ